MKLDLTHRELQVLQMKAHGIKDKEIAPSLGLSKSGVANRLLEARKRNGMHDTTQLCVETARAGLI